LQRLVGFEVEYQVPSFGAPTVAAALVGGKEDSGVPAAPSPEIAKFLFGGRAYKSVVGGDASPRTDGFKITTDHNEHVSREPVRAALAAIGKIAEADKAKKDPDSSSNVEYVTPALDELEKGADKAFGALIDKVVAHAQGTLTQAEATAPSALKAPAEGGVETGTIEEALGAWLSTQDYEKLVPTLAEFRKELVDRCYLQATVGVLPSSLQLLYLHAEKNVDPPEKKTAAGQILEATNLVAKLGEAAFMKDAFAATIADDKRALDAFKGIIRLTASYLVGQAIVQTSAFPGNTVKNAVPFLLKINPTLVQRALPAGLQLAEIPDRTLTAVAKALESSPLIKPETWIDKLKYKPRPEGVDALVLVTAPVNLLKQLLRGELPALASAQTGGSTLPGPDALPEDVSDQADLESGVPVEFRYIREHPAASELKGVLMDIVKLARTLNMRNLTAEQRTPILARVKE
jgi:hypothetical protein